MPYTIPSYTVRPGSVYQPYTGLPSIVKTDGRAAYFTRGGSIGSGRVLDQLPSNNGTRRTGEEGRCYTADGTDDEVNFGDIGSAIWFSGWVRLNSDNQCLFSLSNDTNTNLIVSAGVLTAGATLTLSGIKIDDVSKTASEAGVLLNDNAWHFLSCGIGDGLGGASTADDVRFFTDGTNHGSVSGFDWRFWSTTPTAAELTEAYSGATTNRNSAALSKYALWAKCDEQSGTTAYDSSGNGLTGTLTNITAATFHATQDIWSFQNQVGYNKRMYFDGLNDYVDFASNPIPAGDITMESTFIASNTSGTKYLFGSQFSGSNGNRYLRVNAGNVQFEVWGSDGTARVVNSPISTDTLYTVKGRINLTDNQLELWVNDVLKDTLALSETFSTLHTQFRIGARPDALNNYFQGIIYDCSVYNSSETAVWSVNGYGNTDADWTDQVGSNDGTVNGSPSNILLPRDESDPTNDVLGNPLTNIGRRPNDGKLNGSNCLTADGTLYIAAAHLAGTETVVSSGGTSTPSISAGRIDFTAGTCWDLTLSDGTHYPLSEGGGIGIHDDSGAENHGILTNATLASAWGGSQDDYHNNITSGFVHAYQPTVQVYSGAQAANITSISFKFRSTDNKLIVFNPTGALAWLLSIEDGGASTSLASNATYSLITIDNQSDWGTTRDDLHTALCDGSVHDVSISGIAFSFPYDTNGVSINGYSSWLWDSTTYLWDLVATDSGGNVLPVQNDPSVRLPAVTSSAGPYSIPLTNPAGDYHNNAETTIDFNPDSTPEMGATQLNSGVYQDAQQVFTKHQAANITSISFKFRSTDNQLLIFNDGNLQPYLFVVQSGSSSTDLGVFSGSFVISVDGSTGWGTTRGELQSAVCDGAVHDISISSLTLSSEFIINGIYLNSYTGFTWDSTTYLWNLVATDSNGDPIYPIPTVTSEALTVPSAHVFGSAIDSRTFPKQGFIRNRTTTDDRIVIMPDVVSDSALSTLNKYTQP